jgi:AcrR family transcriptional regulator
VSATHRTRLRLATREAIKEASWDRIAREGAGALTVRGIASDLGMSPSALYRHFTSLEALLDELADDAYDALTEAVRMAMAGSGPSVERLRAGIHAYRRWGLEHPHRFLLVFGTPLPGSAPDPAGVSAAARRLATAFLEVVVEGVARGDLAPPPVEREPYPEEVAFAADLAPGLAPTGIGAFFGAWSHFHGMTTLDLLGQLRPLYVDAEAFYDAEVRALLARWTAGRPPA